MAALGPKTVRTRGPEVLLNLRMDFLLLLPHGRRIVLEVDGMHHYTTQGRPDGAKCAANMRGDRDLKLAGHEVFRFGAHEFHDRHRARALLQQLFHDLFWQFGVTPAPTDSVLGEDPRMEVQIPVAPWSR